MAALLPIVRPPSALRDAAVAYASRGWHVFPVAPREKRPATRNGLLDAVTDVGIVSTLWELTPHANIAVNCGASGLFVVDLDGEEGCDAWIGLCARYGAHEHTLTADTGGGRGFSFGTDRADRDELWRDRCGRLESTNRRAPEADRSRRPAGRSRGDGSDTPAGARRSCPHPIRRVRRPGLGNVSTADSRNRSTVDANRIPTARRPGREATTARRQRPAREQQDSP